MASEPPKSETRSVSLEEAKAGIPLTAGYAVVLVVSGVRGTARRLAPPPATPYATTPVEDPEPPTPVADSCDPVPDAEPPSPDGHPGDVVPDDSTIEVQLVTARGVAAGDKRFQLLLADGAKVEGRSDKDGRIAVTVKSGGGATLLLPDFELFHG